ncbi:MAG: primosomal protein N' [Planctomycetes bacterium]|nr:primosomal protein N' [Planctomycetota bacterium]
MDTAESLIADVAIDCPGRDRYSYRVPDALADVAVGDCVSVPFGPRSLRGFVVAVERRAPPAGVTLRDLAGRRPDVRVPPHLLGLIQWGARYYRCSLGEFLAGAVPAPVREGTRMDAEISVAPVAGFAAKVTARQRAVLDALAGETLALADACERAGTDRAMFDRLAKLGAVTVSEHRAVQEVRLDARAEDHELTDEQRIAVGEVSQALTEGIQRTYLLYGITGSGKTLVYLELAQQVIASGKQVLLLLPEIGLTPQLAARVRRRFARVAVWHSGFTDGERASLWREVAAGAFDLVVGTRSALFAPLPKPGLIIVDEEHEQSYKQESVPRYHARDLAVVYGGQLGVPVVLGSATPSLESVHNARTGRYAVLTLKKRPLGGRLPTPLVVDMREECHAQKKQAHLSRELIDRLRGVQERGEQAIVLLNRRGWSPVVSCTDCGHALSCTHCDISLTYHKGAARLRCHYCGDQKPMPPVCPACQQPTLGTFGLGTEQLAATLAAEVPSLKILRVDADTVAERQGHAKLFQAFSEGAADCLVGTQMVAKGLDFPRVTLVGILCADRALSVPDFRAAERTYQLVAQVSGRAGRGAKSGTVVVQAFDVAAPSIRCALDHRPKEFVDAEMDLRRDYGYPPFSGLVRFVWTSESQADVQLVAAEHGRLIASAASGDVVLGPNPAGLAFLKGQHRWHALIKSSSRGAAQGFLDRLDALGGLPRSRKVHVSVDVDPYVTS